MSIYAPARKARTAKKHHARFLRALRKWRKRWCGRHDRVLLEHQGRAATTVAFLDLRDGRIVRIPIT